METKNITPFLSSAETPPLPTATVRFELEAGTLFVHCSDKRERDLVFGAVWTEYTMQFYEEMSFTCGKPVIVNDTSFKVSSGIEHCKQQLMHFRQFTFVDEGVSP